MPTLLDDLSEPDLITMYGQCRALAETTGCCDCTDDDPSPELARVWDELATSALDLINRMRNSAVAA